MLIIGLTFTVGITIYLNVIHRGSGYLQLEAEILMGNYVSETFAEKSFFNESRTHQNLSIDRTVYTENTHLSLLEFTVKRKDHILSRKKYFVLNDE